MRFFCVPSFFPRIHFQIHEAFAQLRDSDISVLQSGLLRIDRLSLPDFSSRRFLFLSGGSSSPTAFPLRSYIKHPRTASARKRNARGERRRERRSVFKSKCGSKSRLRTERQRCLYDSFCSVYDGSVWRRNESADAVRNKNCRINIAAFPFVACFYSHIYF